MLKFLVFPGFKTPESLVGKFDGFVKSPSAALPCILRRCGVLPSTPRSSGIVRLASGAFYFAIHSDGFLRDRQI
ncbi:MAG: hypothetical protein NTY64_00430 [Deltaproteobacteria bacterium]|nr:hypothetical protein [Deltaproteobacteria bacterium]